MTDFAELAANAKAWPFEQARAVKKHVEQHGVSGDAVIFETGYGPSGLPHIGTFGEVARTTMVINAFRVLTRDAYPVKLLCVSDDMDGMRKVPDNVPNKEALSGYLDRPLSDVPDPFGTHESYGAHMNARLRAFLDHFDFEYEFASATEYYRGGTYDAALLKTLERYDAIMDVMLPTLGEARRQTYSPVLPISPKSGKVLYVPMKAVDAKAGTVTFDDEDGTETTIEVTGGRAKLQWKPDFGMRWAALGVDFEMFGKDHQANAPIYSKICKILGGRPPVQFVYELFLDDQGEKISKSKGNGLAVEDWLRYAPWESLSMYMFTKPRTAKRLYFDVIPKAVDEYRQHLAAFPDQTPDKQIENPAWHIHSGTPPQAGAPITFSLLLNLVSAANAENKETLWGFISQYAPGTSPESEPFLDRLTGYALAYYEDFVKPSKSYRAPSETERAAMEDLLERLKALDPQTSDGEVIQTEVFAAGKAAGFEPLRDWFKALYEVLLGQSQGPRFGSFAAIYTLPRTIALIEDALAR